jgi:hypothetical protein
LDPAKGSSLPDAWECMLDEFSDVFPVDQPGLLPPNCSVAVEIELEEGGKPVAKPAFRLSSTEMDELKKQLGLLFEKGLVIVVLEPACAAEGSETVCKSKGNKGNTRTVTIAEH